MPGDLPQDTAAAASRGDDRVPPAVWVIAAAYVVLELAVSDQYGFQQDELYFLVASHHLAFGYVDQPPLAVLLARATDLFGVSPTAIRILPALAGGAIVVLTARLATLFGGGRAARVIGALAVAIAPVFLGAMHVGNTTPYDLLAWTVVDGLRGDGAAAGPAAVVARRRRRGRDRRRGRVPDPRPCSPPLSSASSSRRRTGP